MTMPGSRDVLIVGSVPLADARQVFEAVGGTLSERVAAIPDGETGGGRLDWINWQSTTFGSHPAFAHAGNDTGDWRNDAGANKTKGWFALREGVDANALTFGELGYARVALESYAVFKACKSAGVVHPSCRFQVSLPTPYNVIDQLVAPAHRLSVEPAYERRMMEEVRDIAAAVPASELAIQWDVAHEVQNLAGGRPHWFDDPERGIVERLTRLAACVPQGASLGLHLCYGDFAHKHFIEPTDTRIMVDLSNAVLRGAPRPIDWIHMPVPRGRADVPYFAPLADLTRPAGTKLYLGLIHFTDGLEGARARIAAAREVVTDFGVATECGFGRRRPDTVMPLLQLHAAVADGGG